MLISSAEKKAILNSMKDHPMLEDRTSRVKGCIYGPNGAGKTTTAVAIARKLIGPDKVIIFVDKNEGYESLRNHKGLVKNVLPIPYQSIEQLYVIAEAIFKKAAPFDNVGALILDDADFMADENLTRLWHDRVANNPESKLDKDRPERPEYLKLGFAWAELLDYIFSNTPEVHLLMTAHDKEKRTKDGETILKIFPGFNPALADKIAGVLQFVVYMTAKEIKGGEKNTAAYERNIQVHPTFLIDAKTRIGCEKVRYEVKEFINHVVEWSLQGRPEDDEADAVRRDIKTAKEVSDLDIIGAATEVDDDAPIMVE